MPGINKIYFKRQAVQCMLVFLNPIPTPRYVLWEVVLPL